VHESTHRHCGLRGTCHRGHRGLWGSSFNSGSGNSSSWSGPAKLSVLIGSSGDAETKAATDAAQAWAKTTGNTVTVTKAAAAQALHGAAR
jgi:hypothetical protein